jgi:hypothetical protein
MLVLYVHLVYVVLTDINLFAVRSPLVFRKIQRLEFQSSVFVGSIRIFDLVLSVIFKVRETVS